MEISQLTEQLYTTKDDKKYNFKIRNKTGKFTNEDKTNLIYKIMALSEEQMRNIINVLTNIKPNEKNHSLDFNVYDLSEDNLIKLKN